jgi:ribosomal protein S18 acetylase RimI-like enzyme
MNPNLTIRTAHIDTDVPGITDIIIQSNAEQTDVDEVRNWLQYTSAGRIARHQVCVDEQNTVIGYGNAIHTGSSPANHFDTWIGVNPPFRRQGIGSAVWKVLLEDLKAQGADQLVCEVFEKESAGMAFAEKCGFRIDRHKFHSILDLPTFDETPFLPIIAALEAQGFRFCTLADLPDDLDTQRKYYELNYAAVRDIPGEFWNFEAYAQFFKERILGAVWFRREGQILAVDGNTLAGFASVSLSPETQSAYNTTTGVARGYRGRHIGLALKVLAARYAHQSGVRHVITDNDSLNAPILAINRKMGYQPQSGKYVYVMNLRKK